MGIFTDIQAALDTRLDAGAFGIDIAYENVPYKPVEGTSWIRATTLYGGGELLTMDNVGLITGIYQIDVFVELEKGPAASNTLLDSISTHFKTTRTLTANSRNVYLKSIERTPAERDGAWYKASLTVAFRSHD